MIAVLLAAASAWWQARTTVRPVADAAFPFVAVCRVVAVDDGDSFVFAPHEGPDAVPGRIRVRLHAVDAPELVQRDGPPARDALAALTHGHVVQIDCYKRDPRGRAVCRVRLGSGAGERDPELELLHRGLVWHFRAFAAEQRPADRQRYAAAEADARDKRRGLWHRDDAMPPWACRERLRSAQACD